ncbi:MAG: DNA translocase FtsK [Bacteroidales bacterium]|nr:DNA translocase FtsK [Bacteroidales bacterium]
MPPYNISSYNTDILHGRSSSTAEEPLKGAATLEAEADDTPATKSRKKKAAVAKEPSRFVKFFTDKRLQGAIGLLLILCAVYALIASISFLSHGADDQSMVDHMTIEQMTGHTTEVRNIGGPVGAWVADTLFNQWFGYGAFVVIAYMVLVGLALIKVRKCNFWALTFRSLVLTISLSIVLGFAAFELGAMTYWGGYHGYAVNALLTAACGDLGAVIVSILLIGIVCYVYLNDLITVYNAYQRRMEIRREKQRLKEEQEAEIQQQVAKEMESDPMTPSEQHEQETTDMSDTPDLTFQDIEDETLSETDEFVKSDTEDTKAEEVTETEEIAASGEKTTAEGGPAFLVQKGTIEQAETIEPDLTTFDPRAELSRYKFPTLDLLKEYPVHTNTVDITEQEENKERIVRTLQEYQIAISKIEATVGPTVTLFEIIPAEGVRIAKIKRLEDDIALKLKALGIRIIAPIPGRGTIGIEVPNKAPQIVSMREMIASRKFQESKAALPMALGATITNEVFVADLTKMPHLLVAGATGQGKSVGLNAIIASLLYKKHPSELKFVLVDPKMVEFSLYSKLEKHYIAKLPEEEESIITDTSRVITTLNSLCLEMDQRYALLKDARCRSLAEYNAKFTARRLNPEKGHRFLPYIVMIVDEFADLIMTAGKEVETPIARIAQKARAVGMHMIIATQRPSTNVITGIIKANFPGRVAFRVQQMVDSRTILDRTGANQLIGKGDMLISINGEMTRVQCAFIDTPEVEALVDWVDSQIGYDHPYYLPEYVPEGGDAEALANMTDRDVLFEEAARAVVDSGNASTSSLQRRYGIGYNRAGKIMDQLEEAGIVGPSQGGKARSILVDQMGLEDLLHGIG